MFRYCLYVTAVWNRNDVKIVNTGCVSGTLDKCNFLECSGAFFLVGEIVEVRHSLHLWVQCTPLPPGKNTGKKNV